MTTHDLSPHANGPLWTHRADYAYLLLTKFFRHVLLQRYPPWFHPALELHHPNSVSIIPYAVLENPSSFRTNLTSPSFYYSYFIKYSFGFTSLKLNINFIMNGFSHSHNDTTNPKADSISSGFPQELTMAILKLTLQQSPLGCQYFPALQPLSEHDSLMLLYNVMSIPLIIPTSQHQETIFVIVRLPEDLNHYRDATMQANTFITDTPNVLHLSHVDMQSVIKAPLPHNRSLAPQSLTANRKYRSFQQQWNSDGHVLNSPNRCISHQNARLTKL